MLRFWLNAGTDKVDLAVKDATEEKYKHLINKRQSVMMQNLEDLNAFIEYFNLLWVIPTRENYNKLHIYKMTIWIHMQMLLKNQIDFFS